VLPGTAGKHRK